LRSLFVVSLPRSLSTRVYHWCRQALGLGEPVWTSDGEVLNLDRFVLRSDDPAGEGRKFTHPEREPAVFQGLLAQLDQVTQSHGFAYKDVVQPFVVSRWLPSQDFRILKIQRPVVDVAYAMLERGWHYPSRVCPREMESATALDLEAKLLNGLLRAERALATLPGETVSFDALVWDESILSRTLQRLYPENLPADVSYLDTSFVEVRDRVLARRETAAFRHLEARLTALRSSIW
jgi:hypothetical protein